MEITSSSQPTICTISCSHSIPMALKATTTGRSYNYQIVLIKLSNLSFCQFNCLVHVLNTAISISDFAVVVVFVCFFVCLFDVPKNSQEIIKRRMSNKNANFYKKFKDNLTRQAFKTLLEAFF